ncbi:hypothetical protein D5R81_10770 [Parashewanella spongiae]|uniref:Uncharacterized protein n=1 Tax=Parashewanella spongiae TaxID=342950 RepID=A0A3A6TTV1_9GAMM|nr:hypothetical protein [Parashewanella spongiae]MCL1078436.1 hypothetical protein [Parashewanella spongiae]RJY14848.1 hypothetical protein D5R81_10770 [Parashewanella spongiae]
MSVSRQLLSDEGNTQLMYTETVVSSEGFDTGFVAYEVESVASKKNRLISVETPAGMSSIKNAVDGFHKLSTDRSCPSLSNSWDNITKLGCESSSQTRLSRATSTSTLLSTDENGEGLVKENYTPNLDTYADSGISTESEGRISPVVSFGASNLLSTEENGEGLVKENYTPNLDTSADSGISTESEDRASSVVSFEGSDTDAARTNEEELLASVVSHLLSGQRNMPKYSLDYYVEVAQRRESSRLLEQSVKSYNSTVHSYQVFDGEFDTMEPIHVLAVDLIFPRRTLRSISTEKPNPYKGLKYIEGYENLDSLIERHRKIPEKLMSRKVSGVKATSLRDPIWLKGSLLPISARQMRELIKRGAINTNTKKPYNYRDLQSPNEYSLEQKKKIQFYYKGFKLLDTERYGELDYHLGLSLPCKLISQDIDGARGRPLRDPVFIQGIEKPLAKEQVSHLIRRSEPTKLFEQSDIIPYEELTNEQQQEIEFLRLGFHYLDNETLMLLDKHVGIEIPPELMSSFPDDPFSLKERYFIKRSSTPISKKLFELMLAKGGVVYNDGSLVSRDDIAKPEAYTKSQTKMCNFLDESFDLLEQGKKNELYQLIKRRNSKQLQLQTMKELRRKS